MDAEAEADAERLATATATAIAEDDAPSDDCADSTGLAAILAALFFGGGLAFLASRETLPTFESTSPLPEVLELFCRSGSRRLRVSEFPSSPVLTDEGSEPGAYKLLYGFLTVPLPGSSPEEELDVEDIFVVRATSRIKS